MGFASRGSGVVHLFNPALNYAVLFFLNLPSSLYYKLRIAWDSVIGIGVHTLFTFLSV